MEGKKTINLVATATKTDIENQFKGTVIFKGEGKKNVSLDYMCRHHKKDIDFEFTENEKTFKVKGPLPHGENIFLLLDERKKYQSLFSMNLIYSTIEYIITSSLNDGDFLLVDREDKIELSADAFDLLLPL